MLLKTVAGCRFKNNNDGTSEDVFVSRDAVCKYEKR